MKVETRKIYIANDGSEWDREKDAKYREKLCFDVKSILKNLFSRPDCCDFTNGDLGYIQQDPKKVLLVKKELDKITRRACRSLNSIPGPESPSQCRISWILRYLEDNERYYPLLKAWTRLYCIDDKSREWGQPYYALYPEQAPNKKCKNKHFFQSEKISTS
jgi:hypothetical protein